MIFVLQGESGKYRLFTVGYLTHNEQDILKVVISEPTRTMKCCVAFPSNTLIFTDQRTDFSFSVQSLELRDKIQK